ncbi:MAG: 6-phosphofructokinase, partial [Alphaproteobacteria bacterium]
MTEIRRIGILTSGGDCAGLNAALRAVVYRAVEGYGMEVIGIHQGTAGLMARPVDAEPLEVSMFTGMLLRTGGTILGTTNKGDPFDFPFADGSRKDRSEEVIEGYRLLGLDALIGIGGDGSLDILRRLALQGGLNLVGIPKTIDNDLGHTEVSIGYATAVNVATDALDHLQPTAASHSRVMILEVMGRDAGHIALNAGIAGGADVILIPEIPY